MTTTTTTPPMRSNNKNNKKGAAAAAICNFGIIVLIVFQYYCSANIPIADALFTSAPPPRFDAFCDSILGKWQQTPSSVCSSSWTIRSGEVEEVMRSCGGAVQGVREVSLDQNNNVPGHYLNRANDGFVYHDNGSYSEGPVHLGGASLVSSWTTSLQLDRTCRVLIVGKIQNDGQTDCYGFVRASSEPAFLKVLPINDDSEEEQDIEWTEQLRCRMSSPSQPWMLQRVKWEKEMEPENDISRVAATSTDSNADGIVTIVPWIQRHKRENGSTHITIGASIQETKTSKAYCREYQLNGGLSSVTYCTRH